MKKVIYNEYGNTDVLQIEELAMPSVTARTILVKVKAASINPLDWKSFQGQMKLMSGSKFPKGVGIDFSGMVEDTGNEITQFKKGDAVFGLLDVFKGGALAEYVLINEESIAHMPDNISFEQAAALAVTGSSALQILDTLAHVKEGTEVLINGATGGIDMFATQLAKKKGAIVTAVTSTKGVSLAKQWGSDFVLDYHKENILNRDKKYDVFIELSGKIPFGKAKVLLKTRATYISTLPGPMEMIGSFFNNLFSSKKYRILVLKPSPAYFKGLTESVSSGLDIVIDKIYPMTAFKEAYTKTAKGGIIGKVVIKVA